MNQDPTPFYGPLRASAGFDLLTIVGGPIEMKRFAARLIGAFVSMRAEIVTLRLQEIGRQLCGSVTVVVRQRRHEGRGCDAGLRGQGHYAAPAGLSVGDLFAEI